MARHSKALLALALPNCVRAPFGAFENEVYECEYDLGESACSACRGTRLGAVWVPASPSCVMAVDEDCCNNDGFQYFLKASLANYHFGYITSMFYPGEDDAIEWLTPNDLGGTNNIGGITAPGRCVWNGNLQASNHRGLAPPRRPATLLRTTACHFVRRLR